MFHKGLDQKQITTIAKELIENSGYDKFSMHRLADALGVKTASLYTHVESMEALLTNVGLEALREQKEYQLSLIKGKHRDEAITALGDAYRKYAKEHRELYHFIMQMQTGSDDALKQAAEMVAEPCMQVLSDYALSEEEKMHWQRILRGLMHGFVSQEENGYFSHYPVDLEESYHMAIHCLIDGIHLQEKKNNA